MAVVAVTFDGTRFSTADSSTDGGTWDKYGSTQSPIQETNFILQGSGEQSNKISNATGGAQFVATSTVDFATTPKTMIAKVQVSTVAAIDKTLARGMSYEIGSGSADNYQYFLVGSGDGNDYPVNAGWLNVIIDPNIVAYRDATVGTPALGTLDWIGLYADITALAKAENVIHSALDYVDNGTGLTLVGGDSTDPDGTFLDFVLEDEDTAAVAGIFDNRWRLAARSSGSDTVLDAIAVWTIGTATATVFTDSNGVIKWAGGKVDAGFHGLDIGLSNASTVITIDNYTFLGEGRAAFIEEFHTNDDVDGTNEELDIIGHSFETGDYVDYSKEGGTDIMGLTDGSDYWIEKVTDDSLSLHTTRANAYSGTSPVNLTASAGTETHRLTKLTDERPDFEVTGTTGSASVDGCSFLNHRNITFTSAASQDGGRIECKLLTQNSADISNVTIVTSAAPSIACLQDPTFGTSMDLHDIDFVQGTGGVVGHALELDTATSYTLTNITFTGYGATASDQAAIDVTAGTGTVTINVIGGDSPTYKTAGATVSIVLNPVNQAVNVKNTDGTNLQNARVFIETAATIASGEMFEAAVTTLTQSAGTATCTTTAVHGLSTNDYVVIRGAQPDGYNKVAQVTVSSTTVFTYTVDSGLSSPATGTTVVSFVPVSGLTDASGNISASRTWAAAQQLKGWARLINTVSPFYKNGNFAYTVDTTNGNSTNVVLQSDE